MAYLGLKNSSPTGQPQNQAQGQNLNSAIKPPAAPQAPKQNFGKSTFSNQNQIFEKNKAQSQDAFTNRIVNPAQQEANQINQNIDSQANQYQKKNQDYINQNFNAMNQNQVAAAAKGDQTAQNQWQNLQKAQPGAEQFAIQGAKNLSANPYMQAGDMTSAFAKGSKRNYSSGMAGLDNLLFQQSGKRQEAQNQLKNLQSGISNKVAALEGAQGLQAQNQRKIDTAKNTAVEQSKKTMSDYLAQIKNNAESRFKTEKQRVGNEQNAKAKQAYNQAVQEKLTGLQNDPVSAGIQKEIDELMKKPAANGDKILAKQAQLKQQQQAMEAAKKSTASLLSEHNQKLYAPMANNFADNYKFENSLTDDDVNQYNSLQNMLGANNLWTRQDYVAEGPNLDLTRLNQAATVQNAAFNDPNSAANRAAARADAQRTSEWAEQNFGRNRFN
jgi:hypothetical protein